VYEFLLRKTEQAQDDELYQQEKNVSYNNQNCNTIITKLLYCTKNTQHKTYITSKENNLKCY